MSRITEAEVPEAEPNTLEGEELETVAGGENTAEGAGEGQTEPEGEDEVIVTIGEEAPPPEGTERAPEWVRELRKTNREQARRIKELEHKAQPVEEKPTVGAKPTLESCDYDSDQFESELTSWFESKRKADEAESKAREAEQAQNADWQARLDSYGRAKGELKFKDFKDFDEAEAETTGLLNVTQQGIIIQGAENPALVVYALGKNLEQAKKLAAITDPVKFSFAVAKMESQLKVTNRKTTPAPEKPISGTGRVTGTIDSTLERLRTEAEGSGNWDAYFNHKRKKQK